MTKPENQPTEPRDSTPAYTAPYPGDADTVYVFRRWQGGPDDPEQIELAWGCDAGHRDRDEGRVRR